MRVQEMSQRAAFDWMLDWLFGPTPTTLNAGEPAAPIRRLSDNKATSYDHQTRRKVLAVARGQGTAREEESPRQE